MELTWTPLPFARGETTIFNETRLGIIRHRGNVRAAYVGNKKLPASKSKKEALERLMEEIDIPGRLF
jgi:hypothetical protein